MRTLTPHQLLLGLLVQIVAMPEIAPSTTLLPMPDENTCRRAPVVTLMLLPTFRRGVD